MRGIRGLAIVAVSLYLAAALEQGLSRWSLLGGKFDFLLALMSVLCLYSSRLGGAMIGFFDGWVYAALDGANMAAIVSVRTVVGYLLAWVASGGIERSWLTALLSGFMGLLLARLLVMFLAPPGQIGAFLGDTIRTAVYNGVLALLIYAVLNRILSSRR